MFGIVCWGGKKRVRTEKIQVLGLPLSCVWIPAGGRREKCRLLKGAKLLKRQGVRKVLVPDGFLHWDVLERQGLSGVDVLSLYRAVADRLVLEQLKRKGVKPEQACVELCGEWADGDLARTARALCPQVRSLSIRAQGGTQRLVRELYRDFGAVCMPSVRADVSVRFGGEGREGELVLCGQPELLGLKLEAPHLDLPEQLERLPLLAVLWKTGRLEADRLQVTAIVQ